jgi:ferredoxin
MADFGSKPTLIPAWPNITVKKAPPPDSKEWEGKPDKLQYFSPNPGAGD